jgi:hypothetical protein
MARQVGSYSTRPSLRTSASMTRLPVPVGTSVATLSMVIDDKNRGEMPQPAVLHGKT